MRVPFNFFNPVKKFDYDDYTDAINTYVSKLSKNTDVISVYQLGSISHPGLSDIDLIIVLQDSPTSFKWEEYSIKNLSEMDRYLFMHEPFVANRSIAERLKFLYPMFSLNHLFGEKINFLEPSKEHYLHFFIQEYVKGYMFWPDRIIRKKKVNIRTMIPQLYATKYSIDIFKIIFGDLSDQITEESEEYIEKIIELRDNIFDMPQNKIEELISELILKTKEINRLMFIELDNYLSEIIHTPEKIHFYLGFFPIIVIFNSKMKYFEYLVIRSLSTNFSIILPERLKFITDNEIKKAFYDRLDIISSYENFIYSNKLEKFMMLTFMKTKTAWRYRK